MNIKIILIYSLIKNNNIIGWWRKVIFKFRVTHRLPAYSHPVNPKLYIAVELKTLFEFLQ
jgi:hypothetical protein